MAAKHWVTQHESNTGKRPMTRGAVFVTAISEAMRIPHHDAINFFLHFISVTNQDIAIYAERLAGDESRELLDALRKDQQGIRKWFQPGGIAEMNLAQISSKAAFSARAIPGNSPQLTI